jgi:hypothetical protein
MALNEKETLREDTCAMLSELARAGFPVGYARIHSWHINPSDPSFDVTLALYYNEETRKNNEGNCGYYGMGANLSPETFALIQTADDRTVFYKIIEWLIHFQTRQTRLKDIGGDAEYIAALEEATNMLEQLDADLGLDMSAEFPLSAVARQIE